MKKVTNMTLALSLAMSVMSVPVYASTGLSKSVESQSTPAVTLSDSNSDDVKKDTVDSKVDTKESPVGEAKPVTDVKKPDDKEVSQPTEEEISKSDTEAKAVKASIKSTPVDGLHLMVDESKKTWGKELTPSASTPILGELVTQAKQSAVQVKSTTGSPVKNATVYLQFSPNKQMKVKTDNNGLVWFNKSDVVDSVFTVAVLKYDFVGTLLNHPTVG